MQDCFAYRENSMTTWINVEGLGQVEVLEQLGRHFGLHPLALEDVLNVGQRPKYDDYESHLFFILRVAGITQQFETEQFSFFLGKNFLITVEETPGNGFDGVRERIRKGRPQIRRGGPDYLAYALIDAAIDSFFPVMEKIGERVEDLEDEVVENPSRNILVQIHALKRELLNLRRVLWPSRDMMNLLLRDDSELVQPQTKFFLRDCCDHAVQLIDMLEIYREISIGIMEIYLSSVNNHMADIMKVLTVISTIFIPLTFIVGIYGMNFNSESSPWNMPELNAFYGYPAVMVFMFLIALGMIYYFRRRGWI